MKFTIDVKNRLIFLRTSDDKNEVVEEATEKTIGENHEAYVEFLERVANNGQPVESMPVRVRAEVAALRAGGLKKAEAKRHADEDKRLAELAKLPKGTHKNTIAEEATGYGFPNRKAYEESKKIAKLAKAKRAKKKKHR